MEKGWRENLILVPMLSWWLHSHYVLQTYLEESYIFTPPQPNNAGKNKNPASLPQANEMTTQFFDQTVSLKYFNKHYYCIMIHALR